MKKENQTLKKSVQVLELKMPYTERSLNNLEQYSRRDCLEFSGVSVTSKENTDDIVTAIAQKVGMQIKTK